jgi:hypothetical protein
VDDVDREIQAMAQQVYGPDAVLVTGVTRGAIRYKNAATNPVCWEYVYFEGLLWWLNAFEFLTAALLTQGIDLDLNWQGSIDNWQSVYPD